MGKLYFVSKGTMVSNDLIANVSRINIIINEEPEPKSIISIVK